MTAHCGYDESEDHDGDERDEKIEHPRAVAQTEACALVRPDQHISWGRYASPRACHGSSHSIVSERSDCRPPSPVNACRFAVLSAFYRA